MNNRQVGLIVAATTRPSGSESMIRSEAKKWQHWLDAEDRADDPSRKEFWNQVATEERAEATRDDGYNVSEEQYDQRVTTPREAAEKPAEPHGVKVPIWHDNPEDRTVELKAQLSALGFEVEDKHLVDTRKPRRIKDSPQA